MLHIITAFVAAVAALTASTATAQTTLSNCAKDTSVFRLDSFALNPSDPKPGDDVSLFTQYTVPPGMIVYGGTVEYKVTFNYIPIQTTPEALCDTIACPITPGTYTNATHMTWPTGVTGKVVTKVIWKGGDQETLMCLQLNTVL